MHQTVKIIAKQIGIILLASTVLAGVSNLVHPRRIPWVQDWSHQVETKAAEQEIPIISLATAMEKATRRTAAFIDARSASEFAKGHIPGAVSIPFDSFDDHFPTILELLDAGDQLVVYCRNRECDDALLLAAELTAMGGTDIVLYVDGFEHWSKNGGEVEP